MDQHFPKLHDADEPFFRLPELPFDQLPVGVHIQLTGTLASTVPLLRQADKCAEPAPRRRGPQPSQLPYHQQDRGAVRLSKGLRSVARVEVFRNGSGRR